MKYKNITRVSVIIPIYNMQDSIETAVKCLGEQTMQDFEIVLVNDGSVDDTDQVCRELQSSVENIVYINKENGGAGSARNAGMQLAKGEYIYFMDADDTISPILLERVCNVADKYSADLVVFGLERKIVSSTNGEIIEVKTTKAHQQFIDSMGDFRKEFPQLYYGGVLFGGPVNKLYRRRIIEEYGIEFPDLRRGQDEIFNFCYYEYVNSAIIIPDVLYSYYAYDEKQRMIKYKSDYFATTMVCYFKTLLGLLHKFQCDEATMEKFKKSFVYSLDDGLFLGWNPTEKLSKLKRKQHIKTILEDRVVQEVLDSIQVAPNGYEKFLRMAKTKDIYGIFRFLNLRHMKRCIKNNVKRLIGERH